MQQPTLTGVRVRSVRDAHTIFHAVYCRLLPIVNRRLDADERRAVRAGNVYVWEERGRNAEASSVRLFVTLNPCLFNRLLIVVSVVGDRTLDRWHSLECLSSPRCRSFRSLLLFTAYLWYLLGVLALS